MSPQKPRESSSPDPATPRRGSAVKNGAAATTPANRRASAHAGGVTPKSAPPGTAGQSSQRKKSMEPNLLAEFLLGRPSPARVAGQRSPSKQRRKSVALDAAGVREELRQEMRAAAVRRLQQPGAVTDRVKAWQKVSISAMKPQGGGVPHAEDVASEPTEVGAQLDDATVTEEDRVRIKLRLKSKKNKAKVENGNPRGNMEDVRQDKSDGDRPDMIAKDPRVKERPKKRIVSDDNWMKRGKKQGPHKIGIAKPKAEGSPTPIPKDFLQRTAQNPPVQSKIKDWASRIETPDAPRVRHYHHADSGATVTVEEDPPTEVSSDRDVPARPTLPADDGIRVKPLKSSKPDGNGIRVKPAKTIIPEDGIRVRPMAPKKPKMETDDGIRVYPIRNKEPLDGIRVRPVDSASQEDFRIRPSRRASMDEITVQPASSRRTSVERSARVTSTRLDSSDGFIEVIEEPETEVGTPTRKRDPSRHRSRQSRSPRAAARAEHASDDRYSGSGVENLTPRHEISDEDSERIPPTVLGNKSLADIPVGYSAFSELDLPLGADAKNGAKRPKAQRNQSFKAVPKVFKKVVSGAKDIIHDKVDPPRPAVNQPASIESWLNGTVDPFVDPSSKPQPAENEQGEANQRRSSSVQRQKETNQPPTCRVLEPQENVDPQQEDTDETPKKGKSPATPASGLKRRRATKSASSPFRPGGKKPFREALKEAFRGESGGYKLPPMIYPSCEAEYSVESEPEEEDWERPDARRRSPDQSQRTPSPDPSTIDSSQSSASIGLDPIRKKRPPTTGVHELSTIVSEESSSWTCSDTASNISHTTVTQATAFTKSTDLSRNRSQKSSLKRRLTKHSDLVSVLSLPDDGQLAPPRRSKSIKSARSLHRKPSKLDNGKIDELLDEFADDEHFYERELKALVDGVVPVLLTHVVHDVGRGVARIFNQAETDSTKDDLMAKSVVNMGVALEKLRNFHRRVPLSNIYHLLTWLEAVSSVYDNYLDVWRLGFQDLVVNLAPASGKPEDEDSLLNALPRNEEGDVLGENGERVDVAYLLKRPLIRVKWMTKFLKATSTVIETNEVNDLLSLYEGLQEKARKRHREEIARMTDEDASNTDTTRSRDLRSLAPIDNVVVDQIRQVAAKDSFALDLDHSSGQRLECQVELIQRDNLDVPADKGDVLIREIGNGTQSWLLFPPVPKQFISARRGDNVRSLVVMVRGMHNGNEWFELVNLSTNNDEQITDWLDILGSSPLPPASHWKSALSPLDMTPAKADLIDIPVGERRLSKRLSSSPSTEKPKTPARYHARQRSSVSSIEIPPPLASPLQSERTPTRDSHSQQTRLTLEPSGDDPTPSWESAGHSLPKSPKRASPNSTPYREDGAPPPPIHRNLTPNGPSHLAPPVENKTVSRVKRRTSSPLKHEYHPSDVSSDSSNPPSDDSESSQSSSDELDEDEVPDTIPGYSIKVTIPVVVESAISDSSITPSNSASQMGMPGQDGKQTGRPLQKFIASVSYWSSKKGIWKDISSEPCSVIVHPGSLEMHGLNEPLSNQQPYPLQSSGTSEVDNRNKDAGGIVPLVCLVLTPVVMIRRSTALDLEVRSPASQASRLKIDSGMFRLRAASQAEAQILYEAVHQSRMNNARYIQLSEEARVRSFGQQQNMATEGSADDDSSSRRRSWFGRKNSYRASTRAPSLSQASASTGISATSFLRRLTGGGNTSFNIDESTVDKHSRPGSVAGGIGPGSLYTSSGSSSGGGGSSTPPRSLSISLSGSGSQSRWINGLAKPFSPDERPLDIRCHLNVQNNRWADKGDCVLNISRPPPGVRQELALYHGMEKRIIVTHATKKSDEKPLILLDAVLGSKCFSMLGTKGIMCSVWENLRDEEGNVGVAPAQGALAGKVTKWCFQCKSVQQADWIMKMVTSEIPGLIMN
ncbi:hypothetical protein B0T26DRAFT_639096 [Lasiosphaeria miniovina]|uniref:Uncharacterized protein n=1 Tax=Lasiosphaeria miniovina TaxID=1954250 RepID=A0AA40E462_9PEZI|nr:uncharacterized protein B0T26DRAFT_639096 [Lasiosphaeria miniovina]KAK0727414.1 hypothetical protein B0T26DRAFT_639096 [Lasiosphaeria miniovina]